MANDSQPESILQIQKKKLKLLERQKKVQNELPHIYGWPWYQWAWDFYQSTNSVNLLCAANQISKSSTQIRKCIDWGTNREKWPELWSREPNQFWYLYPSKDVATIEFEKKWVPEFLPRGDMKSDPTYGWRAEYDKKHIKAIHFYSGVSVYFKTYAQDAKTLQSGTVFAIFCDEELPVNLYDELQFRVAAVGGYFHMVFTATLGQEFWWRCMEAVGTDQEGMPDAFKQQIAMYDCLEYKDGSVTTWTIEKIKSIERKCKSKAEILRRVYGKFIKEEGRTYHAFDPTRHYVTPFEVPKSWQRYSAVDIGSGGPTGHPSAIVFIAIRPDLKYGVVYKGWRGDGEHTTAGQVLDKYCDLRGLDMPVLQRYDWASADFGNIATSLGEPFTHANKSKDLGEDRLNTLLHNDMIQFFDNDEIRKLGVEMMSLQKSTPKNKAKDDFCDAARYCAIDIPWDFSAIEGRDLEEDTDKKTGTRPWTEAEIHEDEINRRRGVFAKTKGKDDDWKREYDDEIAAWNQEYGN